MDNRAETSDRPFWGDADDTGARQRFRALVSAVDDGVFELDADGRFVAVNDAVVETTGYAREDLLGEPVGVLLEEADRSALEAELDRLHAPPADRRATLAVSVATASENRLRWELRLTPVVEEETVQGTLGIARAAPDRDRRGREHQREVQALEAAREGISLLDADGVFSYVNEAYADTFGYRPEEMVGEHWDALGIEADPDRFYDDILPHLDEAGQWSGTTTCVRRDGSTFPGRHSLTRTDDGELICAVSDVTGQRARERELERYETAIQNMQDGVYMTDADRRYTMVNDAYLELIGMEREAVIGEPVSTVVGEEAAERSAEAIEEMVAAEREMGQAEGHHHGVTDRYVENWYTVLLVDDEFAGTTGVVRDITERKAYERKLAESERRYRTLVENFPNGAVALVDSDLRYQIAGGTPVDADAETFADLEGLTIREAISSELADVLEPRYRAALEGESSTFEHEHGGRHSRFHIFPVPDGDGDVSLAMGMSQDITEQVEYERKLEESNERLEQFAHAASHDLQEPLRMISSYLQLIEDRYGDALDADGEEFLAFAVDGAERMREMIRGLLEYSRVDTRGKPFEPVDLEAVVADVQDDLRMKLKLYEADVSVEALPRVRGDRGQLRQLLQNLLDNAVEYSGDEPPRIHVSAERAGDAWRVSVSDEGIGIDPEQGGRVFEVFRRLHTREEHEGTGIGLALCKRIVDRHGGEIWVDSEPGEGATFSFTLPAADGPEA